MLVYAGAVMVMFLFVIAYLGGRADAPWAGRSTWQLFAAVIAAGAILLEVVIAIGLKAGGRLSDEAEIDASFGGPAEIGACSSPTTCSRSRSPRSCCSSPRSAASSSARTRAARSRRRASRPRPGRHLVPRVAGTLFATGALGVLIRRSPLIILLSLEIMLNGANLALIAFARQLGDGRARSSRSP